jgi:hypothetical protein
VGPEAGLNDPEALGSSRSDVTNGLDERIYAQAAAALAHMAEPDLSDFSKPDVDIAMARAFNQFGPHAEWLAAFRSLVQTMSGGVTRLEDADPSEFPYRIKDPATAYQRLVGETGTQLLVMGPFQPPFQFMQ